MVYDNNPFNDVRALYVVGPARHYVGVITIGKLLRISGGYSFEYSFDIDHKALPLLPGFNTRRTITDTVRKWPWFALRIPPLQRRDVQEVIQKHSINPEDDMALLASVGARVVHNPYLLVSKLKNYENGF